MLSRRLRGFTLIEILIAVIVFGIGVLVVLQSVIYNISLVGRLRDNMTMTMLAKEGIELVYNMRDTNKKRGREWNCIGVGVQDNLGQQCTKYNLTNHNTIIINQSGFTLNPPTYTVDASSLGAFSIQQNTDIPQTFPSARLYQSASGIYSHVDDTNNPDNGTGFYRIITFETAKLATDTQSSPPSQTTESAPGDILLKVTSTVVNANRGTTITDANSVSIESFIGNY